jgi:hypothetical protein
MPIVIHSNPLLALAAMIGIAGCAHIPDSKQYMSRSYKIAFMFQEFRKDFKNKKSKIVRFRTGQAHIY